MILGTDGVLALDEWELVLRLRAEGPLTQRL
jgi:hypothetical protein